MSPDLWFAIAAAIGIVVVMAVTAILATFQHRLRISAALDRLKTSLERLEYHGENVKQDKDAWLDRWLDHIPWPKIGPFRVADLVTLSRLVLVGRALWLYHHQQFPLALLWFALGWLTDLLDGPIARAEKRRHGSPSTYGHILDVTVDIICFASMTVIMAYDVPWWFVPLFATALAVRSLFGLYLLIRLVWLKWLPLAFMPESIAGKYKTVFVTLAFGMIMLWPQSGNSWWTILTFGLAITLEMVSLTQQGCRAISVIRAWLSAPRPMAKIIPFPKTGTDNT